MTHGHRDFTVCSCSSLPVLLPGVSSASPALKCSITAVMSGEPVIRNARTNARRRIAASRHCGSRCNHAPRPGSFLAVSTVTALWPFPPSAATTRSSSTASSRFRQPTHVRTGPSGRLCGEAGVSRWITVQSSHTWSMHLNGHPRRSIVARTARSSGRYSLGIAADIDAPAGQPGRQPGVLPFLADRERQLEIRNDDAGGAGGLVDDAHRHHLGR